MSKDKYCVTRVGEESPKTLTIVAEPFTSTKEALKWVRNYAEEGVTYAVIKINRIVEVETVSTKKVRDHAEGK